MGLSTFAVCASPGFSVGHGVVRGGCLRLDSFPFDEHSSMGLTLDARPRSGSVRRASWLGRVVLGGEGDGGDCLHAEDSERMLLLFASGPCLTED